MKNSFKCNKRISTAQQITIKRLKSNTPKINLLKERVDQENKHNSKVLLKDKFSKSTVYHNRSIVTPRIYQDWSQNLHDSQRKQRGISTNHGRYRQREYGNRGGSVLRIHVKPPDDIFLNLSTKHKKCHDLSNSIMKSVVSCYIFMLIRRDQSIQ